jgi:hypothetical protein
MPERAARSLRHSACWYGTGSELREWCYMRRNEDATYWDTTICRFQRFGEVCCLPQDSRRSFVRLSWGRKRVRSFGIPHRHTGGLGGTTLSPKFRKSWAKFPVPWNIRPQQPNQKTGFAHFQIEWNPWLGGYRPQIPVLFTSVLNWICWTSPPPRKNFWVFHWPETYIHCMSIVHHMHSQ